MPNTLLLQYLAITVRSRLSRLSTNTGLVIILLTGLALFIASFFWLIGKIIASPVVLSLGLMALLLMGIWGGLSYVTSFRPNGWWWLSKSSYLYLKALPTMLISLLIAAIVILPYYLDLASYGSVFILEAIVVKVIILLLALAAVCLGLAVAVGARRLTRNPYLRVIAVVMAAYGLGLVLLVSNVPAVVHQALINTSTDALLVGLLLATGLFGACLLGLQLALDATPLSHQPPFSFWANSPKVRLLNQAHHPAVSYFLTRVAFYARSSFIHRRLAVFFLLVMSLPYLSSVLAMPNGLVLTLELGLVWLLAHSIGSISGQTAATESLWLATKPLRFRPAVVSAVAMLGIIVASLVVGWEFFPHQALGVMLVSAISIGLVTYYSAFEAKKRGLTEEIGEPLQIEKTLLGGTLVSLIFVALPIVLAGVTSPATTVALMILWLIGLTLGKMIVRKLA